MMARTFLNMGAAVFALAFGAVFAIGGFTLDAGAQGLPPPPGSQGGAPPGASFNPVCVRLEGQLAALDRGQDAGRADQLRRYEDAAAKQQAELDRLVAQSRRSGCESTGFFSLFSGQAPQCGPMNNQIQQMRANLDRMLGDLQRLKGGAAETEGPRRALLISLAQNNCGPQYRNAVQAAQPRNMFDALFGPGNVVAPAPGPADGQVAGTYRTLCVRTCDGFYFPVSYSTVPSKFQDDERVCKNMCPAAEAVLYAHRNPGEDVAQAVSISGQPYSSMPNAFKYRKEFNAACSCKAPGQTWSEALKQIDDQTVERGDIVVTQERAKQLSLPPPARGSKPLTAAQQRALDAKAAEAKPAAAATTEAPATATQETESGSKKTVRSVGPTFVPVR